MGSGSSSEIGGVRVFKVNRGSPAAEAGLEVFFDFIINVNGTEMDQDGQQSFADKIKGAENGSLTMQVYNVRTGATREVIVRPRKWGGNGLLGATVRFDSTDPVECNGIRVLEVFPNSPAAHAGLFAFQDFILGTSQNVFHDIDELVGVVTASIGERIQIYVYNSESESVREVSLVPNNDWGGDGLLGCDIGTGLLHRIPAPRGRFKPGGLAAPALPPASESSSGLAVPPSAWPRAPQPGVPAAGVVLAPAPEQPPGSVAQHNTPLAQPPPGSITQYDARGLPAISPTGVWPGAPSATAQPDVAALQAQIMLLQKQQAELQSTAGLPPPAPPSTPMNAVGQPAVDFSNTISQASQALEAVQEQQETPAAAVGTGQALI